MSDKCKGLYLRYRKSSYIDGSGLVTIERLYPLKRMSCSDPECKVCVAKQWEEDIKMVGDDIRNIVYFKDTPKDMYIFQAKLNATSLDGRYADEWEYVLTKYEPKELECHQN